MSISSLTLQDKINKILKEKKIENEDINLAFRRCAAEGDVEALITLSQTNQIDVNRAGLETGRTALHNLILYADKIVKTFSENGFLQFRRTLCFLLAEGADPHQMDKTNESALTYWDKIKKTKIAKAPKDFLRMIDNIFEIGIQIKNKKMALKKLLENNTNKKNPGFILFANFHYDNAYVKLLKRKFSLLQALGYHAICYEWPYTSENPRAVPFMLQQHAKAECGSKEEMQALLHQSRSTLTVEQHIKFREVEVEFLKFIQENNLHLYCIDPFLCTMDNRDQSGDIIALRDEGMAAAIALTLATQQKAIGIAGIAHSKGIKLRLQRLMPDVKYNSFFVHSETDDISRFVPHISDTIISVSENSVEEDLIFFDMFFSEEHDALKKDFKNEIETATGLKGKSSELIFAYCLGNFAVYNPSSNSQSSQRMRKLLEKTN